MGIPVSTSSFEPPFCPLHDCVSPCIQCIYPEVAKIILEYNKNFNGTVVMQCPDENAN